MFSKVLMGAVALASTVLSAPAVFTPQTGISLAVSVPSTTSSSGSGNIYMQISAPTTYAWASFGIGTEMAGSTIFVIYTDGNGNVTLSPRNGVGTNMPQYSSSIAQSVTLLEGSGVANGAMVANIKYTVSNSVLNAAGTSTNWIAAWYSGSAMNSASTSASIRRHDSHAQFTMDLSNARQATDVNPFIAAAAVAPASSASSQVSPASSSANSNPSTRASSTGAAVATSATTPSSTAASGNGVSTPVASGNGVSVPVATSASGNTNAGTLIASSSGSDSSSIETYQKAHGIIMGVASVLVLPIGAIIMRLGLGVWLHAASMALGYILLIAGLGLGVKLGDMLGLLYARAGATHTIFGTVIVVLFIIQPVLGLIHHRRYIKTHKGSVFGVVHMWYGRALIILAVVNGGLGLALSGNSRGGTIAYGVVAGVVGAVYVGLVVGLRAKEGDTRDMVGSGSDDGSGRGIGGEKRGEVVEVR